MSLSKPQHSNVVSVPDQTVEADQETSLAMKFFKFAGEKMHQSSEPATIEREKSDVPTRFIEASVVLLSNPFYEPSVGSLPSMEEIMKIKNVHEVRDQLRALEAQQTPKIRI